jgi:hypothetical protein
VIPIRGHFTIVKLTLNPALRCVVVDGCKHLVSPLDGVDNRKKFRTPWSSVCKNFVEFAMREHEIFCKGGNQ